MSNIKIAVIHRDKEYAVALAKYLSLYISANIFILDVDSLPADLENYDVILSSEREILIKNNNKGILLTDEISEPADALISFSCFEPVRHLTRLLRALPISERPAFEKNINIPFTAFFSAVGGAGTSSSAVCYGRIKARLFQENPLIISFDPVERRIWNSDVDEYGLHYSSLSFKFSDTGNYIYEEITKETGSKGYSEVILDIPYGISASADLIDMCEKRVVVKGWNENRYYAVDKLYEKLCKQSEFYSADLPENYVLVNHFDEYPDDIHGQLGGEVLELAKRMANSQT